MLVSEDKARTSETERPLRMSHGTQPERLAWAVTERPTNQSLLVVGTGYLTSKPYSPTLEDKALGTEEQQGKYSRPCYPPRLAHYNMVSLNNNGASK